MSGFLFQRIRFYNDWIIVSPLLEMHIKKKFFLIGDKLPRWAFIATLVAVFSFIFRMPYSPQPVDVFFALAILLAAIDERVRRSVKEVWPYLRPFILFFGLFLLLFIAGQIYNYFTNGVGLSHYILLNYARFLLNAAVFLFVAIIVHAYPSLMRYIGWSVLVSTLLILPVYFVGGGGINVFIADGYGGRLGGIFQESPIIFALWMGVAFLVGLGFFLDSKKLMGRVVIGLWLGVIANFILWSATRSVWVSLVAIVLGWCWFALFFENNRKKAAYIFCVVAGAFLLGYAVLSINTVAIQRTTYRIANLARSPYEEQIRTRIWKKVTPFYMSQPVGFGLVIATPDAPLIDVGADVVERFNHQSFNTYLEVLGYGGLGAFFLLVLFLAFLGRAVFYALRDRRFVLRNTEAIWIAAAFFVLADIFFADAFLFRHLWFVLGMLLGVLLTKNRENESLKI